MNVERDGGQNLDRQHGDGADAAVELETNGDRRNGRSTGEPPQALVVTPPQHTVAEVARDERAGVDIARVRDAGVGVAGVQHPRRQARRHLPKRHRRRPQLLSQPIPRRGRRQQRARPRTRIHQHGVDFRGQNWKIQPPLPLPLTMRSHLIVSPRRGERGHFDKLICNIPIAYKRADICGALMPISACISCSAALTGWWSGTVASGEVGGLDVFRLSVWARERDRLLQLCLLN